ncbi:MAG TPA: MFS transporter [Ilumatobacter sp.]|nr:MFS transporter [Ilumatobacter sp.]
MTVEPAELAALQRRTTNVLRVAVVPAQAAVAGTIAVVTLLASSMLDSDRLAGLGATAFTLGAAAASVPLAAVMRRRGRRPGLAGALAIGAVGAGIAATGGQLRWFWLFLVGTFVFGVAQAGSLQARYVAADLAPPEDRARSIGAIVWIGTLGAVVGPLVTPWERDIGTALGFDEYIGPYLFAGIFMLVGAAVYQVFLRPDPLVVLGTTDPHAPRARPIRQTRAAYRVIAVSPGAVLGITAMVVSQAAMVAVMTMTPPHMKDHGHSELSAYVIALHVLGMYGLSPFVGRFIDRVGGIIAIQLGAVILATGTVSAVIAGYVPALMFVGLFLLGLGWSLGMIAGTTLLTSSVPESSRVEAQGAGDLTLSACGAAAAFGSGFVKSAVGFHILADLATAGAAVLLVVAWVASSRVRRTAPAAG